MEIISDFFEELISQAYALNFPILVAAIFSAFGAIFIISLLFCTFSQKAKKSKKTPYYATVKLFSALTFIVFLSEYPVASALICALLFWCVAYLTYGVLCLFTKRESKEKPIQNIAPSNIGERQPVPQNMRKSYTFSTQRVQNGVRLEHAIAISDKLLLKSLTRSDRQEIEKIKSTLNLLRDRESFSQEEGAALNDMFNALLKLMAKYDM